MVIAVIILAVLLPVMTIGAFVVGYNMNAPKKIKILSKQKKHEPTEAEIMMSRIDNAQVYKTENE